MKKGLGFILAGLGLIVILSPGSVFPQTVLAPQEVKRVVVTNVTVQDEMVSGELRNNSANVVRDVQLLIRYIWLWKNEFHPGSDDPSRSVYYNVPGELPANGTTRFQYSPNTPLPKRTDGSFNVQVSVASFTEVIMPSRGVP